MDHMMVLSNDYCNRNRRRRRTNAPPSRAISMAMSVRRCNTERITQCSMTRALPEATGRRHWATTRFVSPRWPPGRQSLWTCTHFDGHFDGHRDAAVLYPRIARWRRFVAFIKATKRHHPTSTRSDSVNRSSQCCYFRDISSSNHWKRAWVALMTIGVWHINLMGRT